MFLNTCARSVHSGILRVQICAHELTEGTNLTIWAIYKERE